VSEEAALLRELIAELRGLPSALALAIQSSALPAPGRSELRDGEQAKLVRFITGIASAVGDRVFSAGDLLAHADVDVALKGTLEHAVGPIGSSTARRVGKRLQRARGQALQGYKTEKVGSDRTGALWRITAPSRLSLSQQSHPRG
jgi:hypothetical protein